MNRSQVIATLAAWADERPYVARVYLFGSHARGDTHSGSDVDVSVDFHEDHHWTADDLPIDEETLNARLGGRLSLHQDRDDVVFRLVRTAEILTVRGKLHAVLLPPNKPR